VVPAGCEAGSRVPVISGRTINDTFAAYPGIVSTRDSYL
jgi:hypothetical protein